MSALHLDVTGDDSPEKLKNENHSEDDADSDFDDGGSQKRRPRIQRAEDFDDGHTEEASNVPAKNAWELSPPKEAEVDPWAEPSTEPAKFKTDVAKANESEEQDLWGQEPKRGSGARARGARGGRGAGDRGRGWDRGRGGDRGRGASDRGRGTSDRGRGGGDRGRGGGERARGERARGRGAGRGTGRGGFAEAKGDTDTGTETNNKGKAPGETQNTEVLSTEQSKASPREEQETKSREPKNKGPRSSKPPPPKKQEQTTNTDTTDAWALPPISTTEQDAGWGVTASDDAQGATSGGWGDTPASAGWGDSPASEKPNSPKTFKRPPMYLNPDRVKTGGSERTKLSEEELAQRMEKIRLQNERIKEKRLEVVADEEQFAAEQAAAKQKREELSKIQDDINRERQRIAEKKVSQAQRREWDSGKPGVDASDEGASSRGRGRGRGRGGGRGRGRGGPPKSEQEEGGYEDSSKADATNTAPEAIPTSDNQT